MAAGPSANPRYILQLELGECPFYWSAMCVPPPADLKPDEARMQQFLAHEVAEGRLGPGRARWVFVRNYLGGATHVYASRGLDVWAAGALARALAEDLIAEVSARAVAVFADAPPFARRPADRAELGRRAKAEMEGRATPAASRHP